MTAPLLSVEDLRTYYDAPAGVVRAVDGMSFDVRPGETVGIVGESGAGKTVAARSLLRLVDDPGRIVGGEVRFRDETIVGFDDEPPASLTDPSIPIEGLPDRTPSQEMLSGTAMRERVRGNEIAIVLQDPAESLNPVFSVGEQLREVIAVNRDLTGADARDEAIRLLREVRVPEATTRYDASPHELSGGTCQRVAIAMALACEPSLLVADEPTTALDVTVEGQIVDLVADLQETYGTSVIWVTHDMGVVAEVCDRVNVAYAGEIVEGAPVEDLFYDTKHPYTAALLDSIPRPDRTVDSLDPIPGAVPDPLDLPEGCRFHPRCPDAKAVCRRVNPDCRAVGDDEGHRAACLAHEAFEAAGYATSEPIPDGDGGESDA